MRVCWQVAQLVGKLFLLDQLVGGGEQCRHDLMADRQRHGSARYLQYRAEALRGLVLLFSTTNAQLLAIMNDGLSCCPQSELKYT